MTWKLRNIIIGFGVAIDLTPNWSKFGGWVHVYDIMVCALLFKLCE